MIMPRSSDYLSRGVFDRSGLDVVYCDLVETARTLSRRHRCGPSSGAVLAEALSLVALLSATSSDPRAVVLLLARVDGPIQGMRVECAADGALRGAPYIKSLDEMDARDAFETRDALGNEADVLLVESTPNAICARHDFVVRPAVMELMARIGFRHLRNRRAIVALAVFCGDTDFDSVRAISVSMPRGTRHPDFQRWAGAYRDGTLHGMMEEECPLGEICESVIGAQPRWCSPRSLRFECSCADVAQRVGIQEGATDAARDQRVFCPLCGLEYRRTPVGARPNFSA